jgi:hypothetical protein
MLDFTIGWFADPIYHGTYPSSMRSLLGDRLPDFGEDEWREVKGSGDFYGMNTYVSHFVCGFGLFLRRRFSINQPPFDALFPFELESLIEY